MSINVTRALMLTNLAGTRKEVLYHHHVSLDLDQVAPAPERVDDPYWVKLSASKEEMSRVSSSRGEGCC